MGGSVNVAVRFPDGRALCQRRWTNNTPFWFKNAKLFNADINYIQSYLDLTKGNNFKAGELGKPVPLNNAEYGLIVIDYLTMTMLDNNGYSTFDSWDPIMLYAERHPDTVRAEFYQLVNEQRIRVNHITWDNRDYQGTVSESLNETPITIEEADEVGRQWRENFSNESRFRSALTARQDWRFEIITAPFDYIKFDELSTTDMRKKLKELQFPMSRKEGLNV